MGSSLINVYTACNRVFQNTITSDNEQMTVVTRGTESVKEQDPRRFKPLHAGHFSSYIGLDKRIFHRKIKNMFLPMFWMLKRTVSLRHMFWLRNKKIIFCYALLTKGQSLRFILSLRMYSSFITSRSYSYRPADSFQEFFQEQF